MTPFQLYPISEAAITIQFESGISHESLNRVLSLQSTIAQNKFSGFIETVPAYTSLTVYFDLSELMRSTLVGDTPIEKLKKYLDLIDVVEQSATAKRIVEVPVCYDKEFGLDMNDLSQILKLSSSEIVDKHSSKDYTVFMIGFTPGFPYMGELDETLHCPRKSSPRKKVPAGSVAMAGKQTGIYPFETPGGWQIIGRTPLKLFDVSKNSPAIFQSGMEVRFQSITKEEFNRLSI